MKPCIIQKQFCILFTIVLGLSTTQCNNAKVENKTKEAAKTNTSVLVDANTATSSFLFVSDIHLINNATGSTQYGEDAKIDIWKKFLAKGDSLLAAPNAPAFIVYTGDLPAHYGKEYLDPNNRATHNAEIADVLTGLRDLATRHNKPLFYLPGNNDAVAGDYFPFSYGTNNTPFTLINETQNPYPAPNTKAVAGTPPCIISQPDTSMCYYAANPVKGIRLIALNTVVYTNTFFKNAQSQGLDSFAYDKADAQIKWLGTQLKEAKSLNEKVYIAMHIPPGLDIYSGNSTWTDTKTANQEMTYTNQFLSLVNAYKDNCIEAILYGHTHMDELRLLYNKTADTVATVAISCPGISSLWKNNPGFKTVIYDATTKALLDFTTHYTTLPNTSSSWGNNSYSYSKAFNKTNTTQSIYNQLSQLSKTNFTSIASSMQSIYMVNSPHKARDASGGIKVLFQ
jgi:sphingomyelin phosphodiesterase acid-like 3